MQHFPRVPGLCPAKTNHRPAPTSRVAAMLGYPFTFCRALSESTQAILPNTGLMRYSLPMSFLKNLKRENKPWAVLGMSRREYEVKRPWKEYLERTFWSRFRNFSTIMGAIMKVLAVASILFSLCVNSFAASINTITVEGKATDSKAVNAKSVAINDTSSQTNNQNKENSRVGSITGVFKLGADGKTIEASDSSKHDNKTECFHVVLKGRTLFKYQNSGASLFQVNLWYMPEGRMPLNQGELALDGKKLKNLANGTGAFSDSWLFEVDEGPYILEVYSSGNWAMSFTPMAKAMKQRSSEDGDSGSSSASSQSSSSFRFSKDGQGIIEDKLTGLQWFVGPNSDTNWNQAQSWAQSLSVGGGGWRLPTRGELFGLNGSGDVKALSRDYNVKIDQIFQLGACCVWSGETRDSSSAWAFLFGTGEERWGGRGDSHGVRAFAVRSR